MRKNPQTKVNIRVAQPTTTELNCITVSQQYRWFFTVEIEFDKCRQENEMICRCGCNKSVGELIDAFLVGGDEMCFQACENGGIKVLGATVKNKHQKNIAYWGFGFYVPIRWLKWRSKTFLLKGK